MQVATSGAVTVKKIFERFKKEKMGLAQSSLDKRRRVAAGIFSAKGWPAFMWSDDLYKRMNAFKMKKSMLGQRVRFYDDKNMCIEYARVAATDRKLGQLYQRIDGPCDTAARMAESLRTFPEALPASSLSRQPATGLGVLVPTTLRGEYAELLHPPTGRCAAYRRTTQGTWIKMDERCRDTTDEVQVARALKASSTSSVRMRMRRRR